MQKSRSLLNSTDAPVADTQAQQLAQFVSGLNLTQVPGPVVQQAKRVLLDWLGSALAGASRPPSLKAADLVRSMDGCGRATILATGEKSAAPWAAWANGVASCIVQLDDLHRSTGFHPAGPILPAALASAEAVPASGIRLLEGILAGYEVGIRATEAGFPHHNEVWMTMGTTGALGAAVAAGKILGLSRRELAHALGHAANLAAGLRGDLFAGDQLYLIAGQGAEAGVRSAIMAQTGFTSSVSMLENAKGFYPVLSGRYDLDLLTRGLGSTWKIMEMSFKLYPSCGHTHPGIETALRLARAGVKAAEVKSIKVRQYGRAVGNLKEVFPETVDQARFSIPFGVALALLYGRVDMEVFSEENLNNPEVRGLMEKVTLEHEPLFDRCYPEKWETLLQARLADGRFLEEKIEYTKGDLRNPLTDQEAEEKFLQLAQVRLGKDRARVIMDRVQTLEECASVDRLLD